MIVWLASYPRSGNTLLRTILHRCFDVRTYHRYQNSEATPRRADVQVKIARIVGDAIFRGDWRRFYLHACKAPETSLIKTHEFPEDDQPAIYVVRDGRSACLSYHEFQAAYYPQAGRTLEQVIRGDDIFGGWSQHYRRWSERKAPTLLLHFEELRDLSAPTLARIGAFIAHKGEIKPWVNPREQLASAVPDFVREGAPNWCPRKPWDESMDRLFFATHRPSMESLGYYTPEDISRLSRAAPTAPRPAPVTVSSCSASLSSPIVTVADVPSPSPSPVAAEPVSGTDLPESASQPAPVDTLVEVLPWRRPLMASLPVPVQGAIRALWRPVWRFVMIVRALTAGYWWRSLPSRLKTSIAARVARAPEFVRQCARAVWRPLWRTQQRVRHALGRWCAPRLGSLQHHLPKPLQLPQNYFSSVSHQSLPGISIVTACLRQGHFIERTLRSVLDQGYPSLEYFVRDAASDDGTVDVLRRYDKKLTNWVSQPDNGQTHALNNGFADTRGEILAYLNADDLLLPGALHYVGNYFRTHPDVDVVYGHRILIDEQDREIGRWVLPPHDSEVMSWVDFVPQETLFWRRRAWDRIGACLDERFHFAMDWDLLLRLRNVRARFVRLPRFLGAFRIHPTQKTSDRMQDLGKAEMRTLRARAHGRVVSHKEIHRAIYPYLCKHLVWHYGERIRASMSPQFPLQTTISTAGAPQCNPLGEEKS